MTSLIIFSLIRFWSEYFEDHMPIFTKMNKEGRRMILGGSNLKDWIIFGEISMEGKYSIMMNMERNQNLSSGLLTQNMEHPEYHGY